MPEKYYVIGLMSGTSLDGLDIAYIHFAKNDDGWQYNIIKTASIVYDDLWRQQLTNALTLDQQALIELDQSFGAWLGQEVKNFVGKNNLQVDFIASHGHTVFHEPHKGVTLQIGDGQALANASRIKTICDFRSYDVSLGGQGAPLVPIGDDLLFSEYIACLNLGGIANISFEEKGQRRAFDIGMANLPLNYYANKLGYPFDENGQIAAKGEVNRDLLTALNRLGYYRQAAPKSLGVEWFIAEMQPLIDSYNLSVEDVLATLAEHETHQIATVINTLEGQGDILVTGGGAFNQYFIAILKDQLRAGLNIHLPNRQLIEFKEALIFGLMGTLRFRNEINCLKSVTGASKDSSSGMIFDPDTI